VDPDIEISMTASECKYIVNILAKELRKLTDDFDNSLLEEEQYRICCKLAMVTRTMTRLQFRCSPFFLNRYKENNPTN